MIIDPHTISRKDRYKLSTGTILPRPIAWVSTMSADGTLNLAPFSFFTIACSQPMTLLFCPQMPEGSTGKKDTLNNIEMVPEFVINIAGEALAAPMNLTATALPPSESEFDYAGVTPVASEVVRVPRVAEAPVAFECTLQRIVYVNDAPGGGATVFGEVQRIHIRDDVYVDGYVQLASLQPIGRLAGNHYCRVTDIFEMIRQ